MWQKLTRGRRSGCFAVRARGDQRMLYPGYWCLGRLIEGPKIEVPGMDETLPVGYWFGRKLSAPGTVSAVEVCVQGTSHKRFFFFFINFFLSVFRLCRSNSYLPVDEKPAPRISVQKYTAHGVFFFFCTQYCIVNKIECGKIVQPTRIQFDTANDAVIFGAAHW